MGTQQSNVGMVSPDGRWVWTGSEWVPRPPQPANLAGRIPAPLRRVGGIVVVGLLGLGFAYARGEGESSSAPKVGECARAVGSDDVERVDCEDPTATLRVTSRHDGTTDGDTACLADPTATSFYSFEQRSRSSSLVSFVLCFEDV